MRQLLLAEKLEILNLLQNRSSYQAAIDFNQNHHERQVSRSTVARIQSKMLAIGTIQRKQRSDKNGMRKPSWFIRRVKLYFKRRHHSSLRQAARYFNTSVETVRKVLKTMKMIAYKCTVTQEIYAGDERKRNQFCVEMLHRFNRDPFFKPNILWSDECLFPLNGVFNRQNYR